MLSTTDLSDLLESLISSQGILRSTFSLASVLVARPDEGSDRNIKIVCDLS